ncbi:MAG: chromosomal replication initiator protein DnaA [Desulfovibrio sp.]|nr:chromosomal replication initiator protein DnaA [Desulfovibrio sp.]
MNEQWAKIRKNLEKMLSPGDFKVWIASLSAQVDAAGLVLSAPHAYMAHVLGSRLRKSIEACARPVLGDKARVDIRVAAPAPAVPCASAAAPAASRTDLAVPTQCVLPMPVPATAPLPKWRFGFDDFVVGPSNTLAVAAAQDVCRANGDVRTLFVNATAGLGKTHLAHSMGQDISRKSCGRRIAYMTGGDFASRFIAALKSSALEDFKDNLRHLDVLLFEDVHFLQGKPKMQETALFVVKGIQDRGGRVVYTSSFSPRELQKVDNQLVSQFCSGVLTHIDRPDRDMRRDILMRKAAAISVRLTEKVCDLLAERLHGDVRQLESCLGSLAFRAKTLHTEITCDLALEVLADYADVSDTPDIAAMIRFVCESYGLEESALNSRSRRQECVIGRNTVFYLARKHTDMPLREIGQIFNRRHSTVLEGITALEREMSRKTSLGRQIDRVVALVEKRAGLTGR